jgi:hypothetical protein
MSDSTPPSADGLSTGRPSADHPSAERDPELQALPEPRRPWRRATLVSLALTCLASLALCFGLRSQLEYALVGGQPGNLPPLTEFEPNPALENTWVHGQGALGAAIAGYRRPLDPDRFRLAPVAGNPKIWVELREPSGSLGEHFVNPVSFVGRLVPVSSPGLRHQGLVGALQSSGQPTPPADAWLLIDGESPSSSQWAFGVAALLLLFAGFSVWGFVNLLRPHSFEPRET